MTRLIAAVQHLLHHHAATTLDPAAQKESVTHMNNLAVLKVELTTKVQSEEVHAVAKPSMLSVSTPVNQPKK